MSAVTRNYEITCAVEFEFDPKAVNLSHWVNDEGKTQHRMDGIYPSIVTDSDLLKHLAYNCIVNNVRDASSLDGWADLNPGALTMSVIYSTLEIEETS